MKARSGLVVLAGVAAILLIWRPGRGPQHTEVGVTADLAGRWTTAAPGHADRYLEIGPNEIAFGQGAEGEARHRLAAVFLEAADEGPSVYVLRYEIDAATDAKADLRLVIEQQTLRLESLPSVVWKRSP